jgi:hypothetical protein
VSLNPRWVCAIQGKCLRLKMRCYLGHLTIQSIEKHSNVKNWQGGKALWSSHPPPGPKFVCSNSLHGKRFSAWYKHTTGHTYLFETTKLKWNTISLVTLGLSV